MKETTNGERSSSTRFAGTKTFRAFAIGVPLVAALVFGGYVAVSAVTPIYDDPKRTISLPNDTGAPRLMRRCDSEFACGSPDKGELVQPRESFDFKLYFDEDRTYVVSNADGKTLGCVTVPVANGRDGYPTSVSDLGLCPPGTPRSSK